MTHRVVRSKTISPAPGRLGGRVVVSIRSFPIALSPIYDGGQASAQAIDSVLFEGLVMQNQDSRWVPNLAAEVPTLANGLVHVDPAAGTMDVTYHLRQVLAWSDGQPITAADVIYTWHVLASPLSRGFVTSQAGYLEIRSISVPSPYQLTIHFGPDRALGISTGIYPGYLNLFSALLPAHVLAAVPLTKLPSNGFWQDPSVVSGPFEIQSIASGRDIVLRPNPYYESGRGINGHDAYIDQLEFEVLANSKAALSALAAGRVQLVQGLTEQDLPLIFGAPRTQYRIMVGPAHAYEQLTFNMSSPNPVTKHPPPWYSDPTVLQALMTAVDRGALVNTLFASFPVPVEVANSPIGVPQGKSRTGHGIHAQSDLKKARKLLSRDGWTLGTDGLRHKNGQLLAVQLSTTSGNAMRATELEVIAADWRQIGAAVSLVQYAAPRYFAGWGDGGVLSRGDFMAGIWTWVVPQDPAGIASHLLPQFIPGPKDPQGTNFSRCSNPGIDQSLGGAATTLTPNRRLQQLSEFQRAYQAAGCELPLFYRLNIVAASSQLHGLALNGSAVGNTWNVDDWWLGP